MAVAALALSSLLLPGHAHAFPGANGKIAFVSDRDGNKEIYSMNATGGGLTRLTTNTAKDDEPTWSPDGTKIAFVSNRDGNDEIYVMNASGGGQTRLTTLAGNDSKPAWSPDGTKIGFLNDAPASPCFGDSTQGCVYTMNANGGGVVQLGYQTESRGFDWSPDSERVVFGRYDEGLYSNNADGTDLSFILDAGTRYHATPAWSPAGTRIVFTGYCPTGGACWSLYRVQPDGNGLVSLSGTSSDCGPFIEPKWSPSGAKVAFLREVGCAGAKLYLMNADGTDIVPLTNSIHDSHQVWSPDGMKLAFDSVTGSGFEIKTINANGGGETNLTNNSANDTEPDWQPLDAFKPYPRPGGATPLLVWLVPAYEQCTAPNSSHVAPLSEGSCEPPVQTSDLLTTSKVGQGKASVRLDAVVGNPGTPADEADVDLTVEISDVRNSGDQSDYAGSVVLTSLVRTTDRDNGFVGISETVSDARFDVPIACTPSAPSPRGADCNLTTTLDALVPGMIREGKRTILATPSFSLLDAGVDGIVAGPSCPPTCGTGDEETFLEQGTFTP